MHTPWARGLGITFVVLVSIVSVRSRAAGAESAAGNPPLDIRPAFDVRQGEVVAPGASRLAAAARLDREVPGLTLRWNGLSGSPAWIAAPPGAVLSQPSVGTPEEAARAFLESWRDLFGLEAGEAAVLRLVSVVPSRDGSIHVRLSQTSGGLDVHLSAVNVNLTARGEVRSAGSTLFAGLGAPHEPVLSAEQALLVAAADVAPHRSVPTAVTSREQRGAQRTAFEQAGSGRPPEARLVLLPTSQGTRTAWAVSLAEPSFEADYVVLVDVADGRILARENRTSYATARVLPVDEIDPENEEFTPVEHQLLTVPATTADSPSGWLAAPGTTLQGNNAVGHLGTFGDPAYTDTDGDYDEPFNTSPAALVNFWWAVNEFHDRLHAAGFDEAAGNFQSDNFGQGGTGGDPIELYHRRSKIYNPGYGSWPDVANTGDGSRYSLHTGWYYCEFCGDHDGYPENGGDRALGFDRQLIAHEMMHGVQTRLIRTTSGNCLGPGQGAGLGEGWSDLMPGAVWNMPSFFRFGWQGLGGGRDARHDMTFADVCKVDAACQQHADGMIWGATLWDIRRSLLALDPVGGAAVLERLLIEGMKRTPCAPSYLDARDAILDADTDIYASAHHGVLWNVFASRGMGLNAATTGGTDPNPVADGTVPASYACSAPAVPTSIAAVPEGDSAIRVSWSAPGASAVEIWREDVRNTWDRPRWVETATGAASWLDDSVEGENTYAYSVVALGAGGVTCRSASSSQAQATATGPCEAYPLFLPNLTIADGAADGSLTLSWDTATSGCPLSLPPVVYSIYRGKGVETEDISFEPGERLLVGRTAETTFVDRPPQDGPAYEYLVMAQHGTPADPADHRTRARGASQILQWKLKIPTTGRTLVTEWSFDSGPSGWTADNTADPTGGWVLVAPHGTSLGDAPFAPDEAAGGSGMAWVTGDAPPPASVGSHDSDGSARLTSPTWDGTAGAMLLSFDLWVRHGSLVVQVRNGSQTFNRYVGVVGNVPTFSTAGRYGWKRIEIDLARYVAPSTTMSVAFIPSVGAELDEFAIDNVRVERGAPCSRSALRVTTVDVDDTPPGWGNGNLALDPGETARLTLHVTNGGTATAVAPQVRLGSGQPGVLVHEGTGSLPDIPPAGTATSTGYTLTAPAATACEAALLLDAVLTDAAGTTARLPWTLEMGWTETTVVFSDTFETDKGWLAGGTAGKGRWQRGNPVGTTVGGLQANPEDDSPSDPGLNCYVTENGTAGGNVNATDVDTTQPVLTSPSLDLRGYKRARALFDLWYFDNSTSAPAEDFATVTVANPANNADEGEYSENVQSPTGGWAPRTFDISKYHPMALGEQLRFSAWDRNGLFYPGGLDHVVEAGVDNVRVEADRPICTATGVTLSPNAVGNTLRVDKAGSEAVVTWTASPVDPAHHGAAYYRVYASAAPNAGFGQVDTAAVLESRRPLAGGNQHYLVCAVNAAGTSGDEPGP